MSSDAMEAVVETALVEKIQRLEGFVAELQDELRRARAATLDAMLGPLRLRETVLLYVGTEVAAQLSERLAQEFGTEIANQALRHLFDLNSATATRRAAGVPANRLQSWNEPMVSALIAALVVTLE